MADNTKRDAANVQFRKAQRTEDGKKAMTEYEAEGAAIRAKTARLRALRLARDAAAMTAEKPATKTKVAKLKGKAKAAPLSDYLKDRENGGRDT